MIHLLNWFKKLLPFLLPRAGFSLASATKKFRPSRGKISMTWDRTLGAYGEEHLASAPPARGFIEDISSMIFRTCDCWDPNPQPSVTGIRAAAPHLPPLRSAHVVPVKKKGLSDIDKKRTVQPSQLFSLTIKSLHQAMLPLRPAANTVTSPNRCASAVAVPYLLDALSYTWDR